MCFHKFYLVCDRQKRRIFFQATTTNIQICYYQKIKVNVIFDDISGFCLDICKLSTDSESSHLQIFLEVIRSNGEFFFQPIRPFCIQLHYIAKHFFFIISAACLGMSKMFRSTFFPYMIAISGAYQKSWRIKLGVNLNFEHCDILRLGGSILK